MAIERTISIIKPDAVEKNVIGKIYSRFEENGLRIIAAKMKQLSEREAKEFYAVHKGRPFYEDLVKFMTRNPVMIQVLEGENFAESVSVNAVHGSDSVENAAIEIAYFFSQSEICPR